MGGKVFFGVPLLGTDPTPGMSESAQLTVVFVTLALGTVARGLV